MKQHSIFVTALIAVFIFTVLNMLSCTKNGEKEEYNLQMQTASNDVTLPPNFQTGISISASQTGNYNIDSFIKAKTGGVLSAHNIVSVKILSCSLTLENPTDGSNFANFKSCSGTFHTDKKPDDFGVIVSDNPDVYASSVSLPVDTTEELKDYVTGKNQFTYTFGGSLRRPTNDPLKCSVNFVFNVNVK